MFIIANSINRVFHQEFIYQIYHNTYTDKSVFMDIHRIIIFYLTEKSFWSHAFREILFIKSMNVDQSNTFDYNDTSIRRITTTTKKTIHTLKRNREKKIQ